MYRLDLFYHYNGIRKRKVEVSRNRGVREIGQHTVLYCDFHETVMSCNNYNNNDDDDDNSYNKIYFK